MNDIFHRTDNYVHFMDRNDMSPKRKRVGHGLEDILLFIPAYTWLCVHHHRNNGSARTARCTVSSGRGDSDHNPNLHRLHRIQKQVRMVSRRAERRMKDNRFAGQQPYEFEKGDRP